GGQGSSIDGRSHSEQLGWRDLNDQFLEDGIAEGIEVLRERDDRAGAADEIDALEGVGGSPSCGCHQRGFRRACIMVTPYFTASSITRHSFDNDSSIDIVGERRGLLRGAAVELARPVNLHTVDSSFGGRYRWRKLIKRIPITGTPGRV